MSLTIVIPAYNEAETLQHYLPEVANFCAARNYQLIIVNDGSKDHSKQILSTHQSLPNLTIHHNKVNKGYGGAIKEGILKSNSDYIITIDADGQHDLGDVEKLYELIKSTDADMVVGNRTQTGKRDYYRSSGKWIIRKIAKVLLPINIHDINSGMKIYNTSLAKRYLHLCPDSMAYSDTIALVFISQRHYVIESPITVHPRKAGESTIGIKTAIETVKEILNIVILFNPMRIFLPISIFCILAGIAWGLPIVLRGDGVSGGALLGIMTGIIFFFLGLIAEQLSLIRKRL